VTTLVAQTNACIVCGQSSLLNLDTDKLMRWKSGERVQTVWPEWSSDQRELLITGTHPKCWEQMFGGDE